MARALHTAARGHHERAVRLPLEALQHRAQVHREPVVADQGLPQLDQLLLRVLEPPEPAVHRQHHRLRHHQLPARVGGHRAADLRRLVDAGAAQATLHGSQHAGDAGRAEADHEQVEHVVVATGARRTARGHFAPDQGTVFDGRAHQREPRDLAGEEQAGHADGLERRIDRRQVAATAEIPERQCDRGCRTDAGAQPMAHAARAVHDHRLPVRERQHAVFGARAYARAAADALRQVDLGMLQARPMAAALLRGGPRRQAVFVAGEFDATTQQGCDREDQRHEGGNEDEPGHGRGGFSSSVPNGMKPAAPTQTSPRSTYVLVTRFTVAIQVVRIARPLQGLPSPNATHPRKVLPKPRTRSFTNRRACASRYACRAVSSEA